MGETTAREIGANSERGTWPKRAGAGVEENKAAKKVL